MKNKIHVEFGK